MSALGHLHPSLSRLNTSALSSSADETWQLAYHREGPQAVILAGLLQRHKQRAKALILPFEAHRIDDRGLPVSWHGTLLPSTGASRRHHWSLEPKADPGRAGGTELPSCAPPRFARPGHKQRRASHMRYPVAAA